MNEIDFGWNAHIDKTGSPCGWCGAPSKYTLVLEPDEYKAGVLSRKGKRVGICAKHNRPAEDLPQSVTFRRRKAKDAGEQMRIDV